MKNRKEKSEETKIPDKGLIFAKSTAIALFIVLVTLGLIFIIISFIK